MPEISSTILWLVVLGIFALLEALTTGTLVSVWFCAGAFAAWIAAVAGLSFGVQTALFIAVSLILLFTIKPFVNKHIHHHIIETNVQALIGTHCIVEEEINNKKQAGTVKADGKLWTARSEYEEQIIPAGTEVTIIEIRGVKLIVSELIQPSGGTISA